jgi:hypothetical protein
VFAFGAYRVTRRVQSQYRLAQSLDKALDLKDRLSTAFFFRHLASTAPDSVEIVEKQALDRIQPGDIERAIPLAFPRAGYMAAALLLAGLGLVGLRYGLLRTLDLQQPLARINFDTFSASPKVEAASTKKSVIQEHLEKQLEELGMSLEDIDEGGKTPFTPTPTEANSDEPGGNQKGPAAKGSNPAPSDSDENVEESASGAESGDSKDEGSGDPASQKQQQAEAKDPKASPKNPGASTGVMDKMKDALASLLNKLGAKSQDGAQEKASTEGEQQQGGQQQMSQKGSQGQGRSQGENQQAQDQQGGKEGESGEQSPGQQQRASQQDGDRPGEQSAKSGTGKSDGDKSIQEAEQLAAMGKISEIFGKRAAEIRGEMSVEVPSGNQQLKTAYTRNSAIHEGAIVESNRNEVPLIYQSYVQRYFEEVRKSAPAKTRNAAP